MMRSPPVILCVVLLLGGCSDKYIPMPTLDASLLNRVKSLARDDKPRRCVTGDGTRYLVVATSCGRGDRELDESEL